MRRFAAAVLTTVALAAASAAWAGWALGSVTSPARTRAMVSAVLDDQTARAEVVSALNITDPTVQGVVNDALADEGYQAMITEAAVTVLTDPAAGSPLADARTKASTWTLPLALLAAALLGLAAVIGRPRRVLRRAALWCLLMGGAWMALPALAAWLAGRWYPAYTGVIAAAVTQAFTGTPRPVIAMVTAGGVGLVASLPWRRHRSQPTLSIGGAVAEGSAA